METELIEAVTELEEDQESSELMLEMPGALTSDSEGITEGVMGGELGKQEFLTLLTTQLTHQDPLDPMDSTAMVAQLAQFSALEQMENLNHQFEAFREQSLIQAMFAIQGQAISLELKDGEIVEGTVERIYWSGDAMKIQVEGELYPLDYITGITLLEEKTGEEEGEETESVTAE